MTSTLALEPVGGETLERLAREVFSDPEAVRYTGWGEADEAQENLVRLWLERPKRGWTVFRMERDGEPIGLVGFSAPDDERISTLAVYVMRRGGGLGSWAGARLRELALEAGAVGVRAITHPENIAAQRSLERSGLVLHGPATCEWAHDDAAEGWLEYRAVADATRTK